MQVGDVVVFVESRGPVAAGPARRHNALVVAVHSDGEVPSEHPDLGLAYCSPHPTDTVPHGRVVFRAPRIAWCEDEAALTPSPAGVWRPYYVLPGGP